MVWANHRAADVERVPDFLALGARLEGPEWRREVVAECERAAARNDWASFADHFTAAEVAVLGRAVLAAGA